MPAIPADVLDALRRELPEIAGAPIELLGEGWNATAWVALGPTRWVLRVPKLEWAAGEIERQTRLGEHLWRLGFPVPGGWRVFRGEGGAVIAGAYRYIEGDIAPTRDKRALDVLAGEVAHFLTRLHALPTDFALRGCDALDLDPWTGRYRDLIANYRDATGPRTRAWLDVLGARLERASHPAPPRVLVHGDLSPEHLLCDPAARIVGVLDFSGPQVTDPAIDFGRLVQNWGVRFAEAARQRYQRPIDGTFRERMLAYAQLEPLRTIEAGIRRELPQWVAWGRRRLAASAATERAAVRRSG